MTTLLRPEPLAPPREQEARGPRAWLRRHRASLVIAVAAVAVAGLATAWNLQGWPGRVDDDEGTYVSQAWAVLYPHHLAHYTYWYDHPPFGWIQIAAYIGLTGGFTRYASAVMAGREFMLAVTVISSGLLYVLARRLGLRRGAAAVAVLAFGLSPLAVYYHRLVSLDNVAVMWLLATLACAASRRRSLAAAFGTGACFAGAVLSKETVVILLPVVAWMTWQHTERRTRRWHLGVFAVTFAAITAVYPLFALLRGELLPGSGHVSLGWALWWQFFGRAGSGSVFSASSSAYGLVRLWAGLDPWLLAAGGVLVLPGFAVRKLRPLALAVLLQVLVLLKGGYVPYFYVTALLPFAALLLAGTADRLLDLGPARSGTRNPARDPARALGRGLVAAVAVTACALVLPGWWHALSSQSAQRGYATEDTAVAWIEQHVPKGDVVVTDDYMWPDLELKGWSPLWLWKVTDPGVDRTILKRGYAGIRYIALSPSAASPAALDSMPALKEALAHSVVVRDFGDGLTIRKVVTGPAT